MSPLPPGALRPSTTRVLLGLLDVYATTGRATVRAVADAAGYRSIAYVWTQLLVLRAAGLCTWDDGRRGTLRPTVTASPVANAA